MSENKITEQSEHHAGDEAELDRLDSNLDEMDQNVEEYSERKTNPILPWIITAAVIGLIAIVGIVWIMSKNSASGDKASMEEHKEEPGHSDDEKGKEVKLDSEMLSSAGIVTETVTQRPAVGMLNVTGAVELNPETTEMATLLVGGRIERVNYGVGDSVQRGAVLAVVSSPQLAQMHGKMHEARTQFELATRNLERVQRSENRVAVLDAKARLDEAEATLKRTKRLIELGAGAGKDLISAETQYRTAKANYDFQSNISLNKEIQEAKAAVETSRVDLKHIVDEMRSLGVTVNPNEPDDHREDTSLVALRAPLS
ncbi:MAG: efflux RND transporter periplasmic adaptor subunit, partial [Pyrinomonadaceae bacterium]